MQKPIWSPSPERIERANLSRFMRFVREEIGNADLNSYAPLWQLSVDQPERFWTLVWDFCGIKASGAREPVRVDTGTTTGADWFPNMRLNVAQNLLRFDDERSALVERGADGQLVRISYSELRLRVARVSAAMRSAGLQPGDRVTLVMPHSADALIIALAAAAVGAVLVAVSSRLSADDVLQRVAPLSSRLVFVDGRRDVAWIDALLAGVGEARMIASDLPANDAVMGDLTSLAEFTADHADAAAEFVTLPFAHPLHALASGDDCSLHGAGGTLIQHLKELVLQLDIKREDKLLVATEVGSAAWTWALSCLAVGCTLLLHESTPDTASAAALWDCIDEAGVSVMMVDAEWIDASRRAGLVPRDSHKLLNLKTVFVADRVLDAEAIGYVYGAVKDRLLVGCAQHGADRIGCLGLPAPLLPVHAEEPPPRALGMRIDPAGDAPQPHPSQALGHCRALTDEQFRARFCSPAPAPVASPPFARVEIAANGALSAGGLRTASV